MSITTEDNNIEIQNANSFKYTEITNNKKIIIKNYLVRRNKYEDRYMKKNTNTH